MTIGWILGLTRVVVVGHIGFSKEYKALFGTLSFFFLFNDMQSGALKDDQLA